MIEDNLQKKALIPISVDNPKFSTNLMVSALSSLNKKYDEIVFFIADDIQLYNKVAEVQSGAALSVALESFKKRNVYFEEKRRWLEKVRGQLRDDLKNCAWTFTNVASFTDEKFYNIWRNIAILYQTTPLFRDDVGEAALDYCKRTKGDSSDSDSQVRLSKLYIMEEIAINIRIRVYEGIFDEYYPFKYPKPLLKVYSGAYGIDVFGLGGAPQRAVEFDFYEFDNMSAPNWIKLPKQP